MKGGSADQYGHDNAKKVDDGFHVFFTALEFYVVFDDQRFEDELDLLYMLSGVIALFSIISEGRDYEIKAVLNNFKGYVSHMLATLD